jgi:hypothetical protein
MPEKSDFEMIASKLGGQSVEELQQLRDIIDALLAQHDEIDQAARTGTDKVIALRGGGSVELKIINKCGPYAYLRFWSGRRHCSRYLGKWHTG